MPARNRLKTATFSGYRTEKYSPYTTNWRTYTSLSERCEDVTGTGDNAPLTITRTTRSGGLINGIEKSNLSGYIWVNYPCAYVTDSWLTSHLSISGQPTDGTLAAQLAARTQPYRPELVSWEYLDSLSSLGTQAKDEFRRRLKRFSRVVPNSKAVRALTRAAKLNLLYQFGILPLISDIGVLLELQRRVDSRSKEISRLYGPRGLRRTVHLWAGSATHVVTNQTIQSQGVLLHANVNKNTKVTVKGHIRWRANFPVALSDKQIRDRARAAILTTDIDPYVVWELMPWSWLIDYFTNLGDIVKAGKNLMSVTHDAVRIMEHRRTTSFTSNHDVNDQGVGFVITCTPMFVTNETKVRRIASPSIIAQETILTGSQLSILGSLAVLRA